MLITKQKDLDKFCKSLQKCEFVTIDTEFLREKTYFPKLCLIQIGDPDKNAAAIDPLSEELDLKPVFDILFDKNILKIFHAGRQDLEIFYNMAGKVVEPLFDTQIAAMVCGYGESIGYENLVRNITNASIDKSVQYTNWSIRPLSEKQIEYALGDVTHLVDVYKNLSQELEKQGRTSWVIEEEESLIDPQNYINDPDKAWERIKIKSPTAKMQIILKHLAAWRERKAQDKNIPKNWVLRDETLADIAAQAPKTIEKLKKIRNIPKDVGDTNLGERLLGLVNDALATPKGDWPKPVKKEIIPPHLSAVIDILKMLLKVKSAGSGVAPKLIASSDDIHQIALGHYNQTKSMKGWRYEVFGEHAKLLKEGHLAIGVKGNKIVEVEMNKNTKLNHYRPGAGRFGTG